MFWFELGPEGYSYGMGFWQAPAVTMAKFRARMDREPKAMEKLARRFQKQDVFVLEGEDYKRPKAAPSRLLTPWYSKKSFALSHDAPHGEPLWSHDLVDLLLEGYEFLLPYYEYMLSLSGDPDPRGTITGIYIASNPASQRHTKAKGFWKGGGRGWSELPGGGGARAFVPALLLLLRWPGGCSRPRRGRRRRPMQCWRPERGSLAPRFQRDRS